MVYVTYNNARDWANERVLSEGNQHLDRHYFTVRERVSMGEILPIWIEGLYNPADAVPAHAVEAWRLLVNIYFDMLCIMCFTLLSHSLSVSQPASRPAGGSQL